MADPSSSFLALHGLDPVPPAELNAMLARVIAELPTTLRADPLTELTAGERVALEAGGVRLDARIERDPLAESMIRYAALLETSLDTAEVAKRLDTPTSRVRQLIARRSLYSVLLDGRRHVLAYQFDIDGPMVPGIARVNAALDPALHPLTVHEWFVEPDAELFQGDDVDATMSPLDWLRSGGDTARLVLLARQL